MGCALAASMTRDKLARLTPGMTIGQVRELMGEPFSTETYMSNDNKTNLIWNYRTAYSTDSLERTHQEITPVIFKNDILVGWGTGFYEQLIQPNSMKQNINLRIKQE